MTEYEIVDALSSLREETGNHVMNFVGVLFGYLAVAYFAGPKLARQQVYLINFLYFLFTPGPLLGVYESTSTMQSIYGAHSDSISFPIAYSNLILIGPILVPSIILTSFVVSLVFMAQVRRTVGDERVA